MTSSSQRRVLIISTTFFPDPNVPAIRMTQWCRHLTQHGWKPYVLCRYYGYEFQPDGLSGIVYPNVTLEYIDKSVHADRGNTRSWWRTVIRQLADLILKYRYLASFIVPDLSIFFWQRHREHILARVRDIQPDVIITTSPPHSNHYVGLWLAAQTGIPWIADFRDPYLLDARFKPVGLGKLRWRAHKRFHESIYRRAWLITHAIPIQARWARRYYPFARQRIRILTNGFPSELLDDIETAKHTVRQRKTVLVAGTIPDREALQLAKAVACLAHEGHDVELKLLGKQPISEARLRDLLGDRLILTGYLSHVEAVRAVACADVLVSFLNAFRSGCLLLSTKLFEYLATFRPVICINPSRSDRFLLRGLAGVNVRHQPNLDDLVTALRQALIGASPRDSEQVRRFRKRFSWSAQVEQLADWLKQLVSFPPSYVTNQRNQPVASVVIPTHNRREILRQTILSALAQSVPVEVLVMDDGSTDGTAEMVRSEFPSVRLYELGNRKGPTFQRNRGIELATSSVVFPIDDDSMFSSPRIVEQIIKEFNHPRVAAVGIPFLNPRLNWEYRQIQPEGRSGIFVVHAFVGAAHAVRKEAFLHVGGYREHFFYMGEEGDLGLRLIEHGYVVRLGKSDPVYHLESPQRDTALADFCGRRNDILFAWHNVPTAILPWHLAMTIINSVRTGVASGHLARMLRGVFSGFACLWKYRRDRKPVSAPIYWLHRKLKKKGPAKLEEIEHLLPTLPNRKI
jgi:glycosyltransferase involved in cell wall biosynthesis